MPTNSKEYMREYYHKNREKFLCKYSGTYYCAACDITFQRSYLNRHNRTDKHKINVALCTSATPAINEKETFEEIQSLRDEIKSKLKQVHQLEASFTTPSSTES